MSTLSGKQLSAYSSRAGTGPGETQQICRRGVSAEFGRGLGNGLIGRASPALSLVILWTAGLQDPLGVRWAFFVEFLVEYQWSF